MKSPVDAIWDAFAEAGRAIADGLTLAAEILCPRDHTAEERLRSWEVAAVAVEGEICDEAEACEDADPSPECLCWVGHGNCGGCSGVLGIAHEPACGWEWNPYCPQHTDDSSAAVSAAADPSPTDVQAAGDEGPGEVSDILPSASLGQPKCQAGYGGTFYCSRPKGHDGLHGYAGVFWLETETPQTSPGESLRCSCPAQLNTPRDPSCPIHRQTPPVREDDLADAPRPEADPGEVSAPSPGEQVSEDDLAAHITAVLVDRPGCFLSDPQIGEFVASDLLADFHITKK